MMINSKALKDVSWLVGLLVFSRLVPHWPNVTALGATVVLAPHWFKQNKFILVAPMAALLISDLVLGFDSMMLFVYVSVFLMTLVSAKRASLTKSSDREIEGGTETKQVLVLTAWWSLSFYAITNFGAWLMLSIYPKTTSGLMASYWNGLPFLVYEYLGTLFYVGLALVIRRMWVSSSLQAAK